MPPYRQDDVSDQKLADIYAFLESLPSASPDAEDHPGAARNPGRDALVLRYYGKARATHSGTSPRAPTATTIVTARPSCR